MITAFEEISSKKHQMTALENAYRKMNGLAGGKSVLFVSVSLTVGPPWSGINFQILLFIYSKNGFGQNAAMNGFFGDPPKHCFYGNILGFFASNDCEEVLEMGADSCDWGICINATDEFCSDQSARGTWPRLIEQQSAAAGNCDDAAGGML